MAYIGATPPVGNFQVCDAISVVNGQAAYTLQVGGVNVTPESANHMLVSLNGILQKPGSSFTVSGSTMTFASNLATGDSIDFVQILGNVLDIGQPSDDTVKTASIQANAVTGAKLNTDVISAQTALTDAPASTDELLISDGGVLKRIDVSLIGGSNTPAFHAYLNSNQSISSGTETKVALDAEALDTDSAFASNKFTVPSGEGGKYFIQGAVTLTNSSGDTSNQGLTFISLHKNGTSIGGDARIDFRANKGSGATLVISSILTLAATDYIELFGSGQIDDNPIFQGGSGAVARTYLLGYKLIGA